MNYIRESFYRKVAEKRFGLYEGFWDTAQEYGQTALGVASSYKGTVGKALGGAGAALGGVLDYNDRRNQGHSRLNALGGAASTAIGGTLGGLAGGAVGSAVATPGIGTVVGAIGGGIVGAQGAATLYDRVVGNTRDEEPKLPPGSNASTTPGTPPKEKSFLDRFKNPGNVPASSPEDKATGSTTPTAGEAAAPATNLNITTGAPTPPKPDISSGDESAGLNMNKPNYGPNKPATQQQAAPPSVRPRPAPSPVSTADTGGDKYGSDNASAGFERGKYAAPDASDNSSGANELRSKQQAVDRGNLEESKSKYMNESITFERFLRKNKYGKNF